MTTEDRRLGTGRPGDGRRGTAGDGEGGRRSTDAGCGRGTDREDEGGRRTTGGDGEDRRRPVDAERRTPDGGDGRRTTGGGGGRQTTGDEGGRRTTGDGGGRRTVDGDEGGRRTVDGDEGGRGTVDDNEGGRRTVDGNEGGRRTVAEGGGDASDSATVDGGPTEPVTDGGADASDSATVDAGPTEPVADGGADASDPATADVGDVVADDRSAFVSTTGHFYRGTIDRITTWRGRLDQTTNWAVIVMAAILTWAFSSPDNPHFVILVGIAAVLAFLVVETHRFRQYDAWRERVRLVERNFVAGVYDRGGAERPDWRAVVGDELRSPTIALSVRDALTHRLRRVYLFLLTVLFGAWVLRVTVFAPSQPWPEAAAVGAASGAAVTGLAAVVYLALAGLAVWSLRGRTSREFDEGPDG